MVDEHIIIALLFLCLILQAISYRCERKDLYNRIMSRNITEYKSEPAKYVKSAHQKVLERWRQKEGGDG